MQRLRDISIKYKLMLIVMLTSGVALLLACAMFIIYDRFTIKNAMISDLRTLADIIGSNSTAAISFDNEADAQEILSWLKNEKQIVAACIYTGTGRLFARYVRNDKIIDFLPPKVQKDCHHFDKNNLIMFRQIILEGEPIGTVFLQKDLQEMNARLKRYAIMVVVILLISSLAAFLIISQLQIVITAPFRQIVKAAKAITNGDLTRRAVIESEDEVGILAKTFNEMVDNLESAQLELADLNRMLEERVKISALEVKEEIVVRRRAEKALRLTQFSVDHAADLLFWIGPDARFLYVNETACSVLNYSRNELLSMTVYDINPDFSKETWPAHWEDIKQRGSITLDSHHKTKDGRIFPVEVTVNYIEFEGKQYYCAFARDITERKEAEEELIAFAAKLEKSNRELQDFAFVASHDLQEPLRKVQAFGDRLKAVCADELSDKGRDYLERMQSAAGRMQTLIKDLLTFSRVTSKAQPFIPVDLHQIAKEVLSDLETAIERLNGRVELSELPVVDADPLQMRQLIQNLISNALKFHKKDETPIIKIYSEIIKEKRQNMYLNIPGGKLCRLVVEDNGIGFDEKYCEKIFTVFQRLHGRSEYEGTGVGLAVCRKIVERHNGTITAKSKPGQGAKFFITIPVEQPQEKKHSEKEGTDKKHPKTEKIEQCSSTTKNVEGEQSFMVPCP